jgi:hypothetical protein
MMRAGAHHQAQTGPELAELIPYHPQVQYYCRLAAYTVLSHHALSKMTRKIAASESTVIIRSSSGHHQVIFRPSGTRKMEI